MNIYPPPKRFRQYRKRLNLQPLLVRANTALSPVLENALLRFCRAHRLSLTFSDPAPEDVLFTIAHRRGKAESYEITANDQGITLTAPDDAGTFYGLGTLTQILNQADADVPHFSISDEPDYAHRGIMLDISRCKVPTMATLFSLIDTFAALKINQLQLYVEHTFAFTQHPLVWAGASPLTVEEVLELKHYCYDRFIELIPNFNSFGHFERWLRHPAYRQFAECPDGFVHPLTGEKVTSGSTLRPNTRSLRLLAELYDEYLPLFDSEFSDQYFNVGGDEPWELGRGASARICKQRGTGTVYVNFMSKIQALVEKRGRKTMFWSDIVLKHPESLSSLSKDLTALIWGYEAQHPFQQECQQMAGTQLPFYVCPGTSSWNALTGRLTNASANLAEAARQGLNFGASGYLITDWGDHGHHQYLPISYPGFLIGACHAWHHRDSRRLDTTDLLINSVLPDDPNGADLLTAAGQVADLVPTSLRNGNVFNRLLFWDMRDEPDECRDISREALHACLDRIQEIRGQLRTVRSNLIRNELRNAIDMASHGLNRLALHRGYRSDKSSLRRELQKIIGRHKTLWLARNRPGGLRESTAHLNRSLKALQ